ncbi:MAG: hypothetical protein JXO22_07570 [Phycisphaerae bacterium]|nr:hypothetical protein [Phycisphaerae bacterium]
MNQPTPAIDGKTFAIGVLSVTACILFVGFLLITLSPQPAYASRMNDRGSDYIMATQSISSSKEGLIVMDAAAKQMLLYVFDTTRREKQLMIQDRVDFAQLDEEQAKEKK